MRDPTKKGYRVPARATPAQRKAIAKAIGKWTAKKWSEKLAQKSALVYLPEECLEDFHRIMAESPQSEAAAL